MPNPSMQSNSHTPRVRNGEPQPAAVQTPEPASAKRDLTSWWRTFSKRPAKKEDEKGTASPWSPMWAYAQARAWVAAFSALQACLIGLMPPTAPATSPLQRPRHHPSRAFTNVYCYTQKHSQEFSVYPSYRAYPMRTSRYRCSTSTAKATFMATCPSWSQNAACISRRRVRHPMPMARHMLIAGSDRRRGYISISRVREEDQGAEDRVRYPATIRKGPGLDRLHSARCGQHITQILQ